jgi:hypothetical protein
MRQQLDELDALLQRMLSLPVNPLNEPDNGPPPRAPEEKPQSMTKRPAERLGTPLTPVVEPKPASPPREQQEQLRSESPNRQRGSLTVYQSVSSPGTLTVITPPSVARKPEPLPAFEPDPAHTQDNPQTETLHRFIPAVREDPPPPTPVPEPSVPSQPLLSEPRSPFLQRHETRLRQRRRSTPWVGPLGRLNLLFDRCAVALGGPGLWLVRAEGRAVLGWIGILLLLGAVAILIGDWLGWSWPA